MACNTFCKEAGKNKLATNTEIGHAALMSVKMKIGVLPLGLSRHTQDMRLSFAVYQHTMPEQKVGQQVGYLKTAGSYLPMSVPRVGWMCVGTSRADF